MFRLSVLALCLAVTPALAQPASDNLRRPFDPGDPAIKGPRLEYRSVLGNGQTPQPEITWPAANEEMARLKGHAGHLRETEPERAATGARPPDGRAASPHHRH